MFYNHLILSGTKMSAVTIWKKLKFYNHLILSGTKMRTFNSIWYYEFYNHLILSGTKIYSPLAYILQCFTIT